MSDELVSTDKTAPVFNEAPDLPFDAIVQFFKKNGVSGSCPACGHENWDVLGSVSHGDGHLIPNIPISSRLDGGTELAAYNMRVIVATCTKCGYMRMHARSQILNWHKSQQQEQENV